MTIVSGHGAQELNAVVVPPGALAVYKALTPAKVDQIIHHLQAAVAANDHIFGLHAQQFSKKAASLGHAFQQAIVTGIKAVFANVIIHFEHFHGKIQLLCAGLAAGHIQIQRHILVVLVLHTQFVAFFDQFGIAHLKVVGHEKHLILSL